MISLTNFQNDIIIFMIIIDYNNASINSGLCFHQQKTTERAIERNKSLILSGESLTPSIIPSIFHAISTM
jgi:hypothetical protein